MTIETTPSLVSPRGTAPVTTILFLLLVGLWAGAPTAHAQDIPTEAGKVLVDLVFATDSAFENRVEISWTGDATHVLKLDVYRDILADPRGSTLLSLAPSLDNVFNDETGDPGVVYNYCVLATYNNGDPPDTATDQTCNAGNRIIFAPTGLAASDGIFENRVALSWVDVSFIETGYYLYRDTVTPGTTLLSTLPADRAFYQDSTAVQGTVYTYCVEAFDAGDFRSAQVCDMGERGFVLPPLNMTATDGQYTDRVVVAFTDQTTLETGYEIKKGKLGKLLRNCTYTGITPEFWNSCDAVCNENSWTMWGIPNCGKGQPGQIGHTGHGAAPARFRNVQVGVMK